MNSLNLKKCRELLPLFIFLVTFLTGVIGMATEQDSDLAAKAKSACNRCHGGYTYTDGKCSCLHDPNSDDNKFSMAALKFLKTASSAVSEIKSASYEADTSDITKAALKKILVKTKKVIEASWNSDYLQNGKLTIPSHNFQLTAIMYSDINKDMEAIHRDIVQTCDGLTAMIDGKQPNYAGHFSGDNVLETASTKTDTLTARLKMQTAQEREVAGDSSENQQKPNVEGCFDTCEAKEKRHKFKAGSSYEDCLAGCK
jgi:hypothetical protein